jgi:hypothetical protein
LRRLPAPVFDGHLSKPLDSSGDHSPERIQRGKAAHHPQHDGSATHRVMPITMLLSTRISAIHTSLLTYRSSNYSTTTRDTTPSWASSLRRALTFSDVARVLECNFEFAQTRSIACNSRFTLRSSIAGISCDCVRHQLTRYHVIWEFQHVAGFRRRHVGASIEQDWATSLDGVRNALDADTANDRALLLCATT